jgi:hypothetical protein
MKSGIFITEDYELDAVTAPTRLMFMTTNPDALQHISYDKKQLEASMEDISDKLDTELQSTWGKVMYRIILSVKSTKKKQRITYHIR